MAVTPMFLLFIWIAGAVCRFSIQIGKYIHLIHMLGKCPGYFKHNMEAVINRINREYGKSGRFKVLLVPGINTPAVFGLIHPKILMPETDYTEKEIYYILKHEMLHYYQHDMMIKILWETLCSVFWWNPAVFLLKKQLTRVLELKVDRLLTSGFSEEEKISYLECIVKSMKTGRQEQTSLMITFATQKGNAMKQRFSCIWANECPESKKREWNDKAIMNSLAWKTILRSPVKSLLTFLLITAASFALFSRVTDYAVIRREAANTESFYHGAAALDNTVPEVFVHWTDNDINWGIGYTPDNNPWPTEEQLAEFSSLPGVTLTDTRYMTAGLVEGCKRVVDESYGMYGIYDFVLEGTYAGYENWSESSLYLIFDDITMLAGKCRLSDGDSVKINHMGIEEFLYGESNPYPEEFWKQLKKGSNVLISGSYWPLEGDFRLNQAACGEKTICVLDNVGENYLDTEEFAYYKELIEAINQDLDIFDIVYTSDMRSIPRFNERKMVMEKGRPITAEDTDACVVSELFLEAYGLNIGDKIDVRLGDRLFPQMYVLNGAKSNGNLKRTSNFADEAELEIVGTYRFVDTLGARVAESDWSYSQSTIFVPKSLLPVSVPDDYEPSIGQFSVFVEDARDIEAFREAAEPLAAKMGVALCFSDGGWLTVKDSLETGALTSLLTTVLYVIGAALAMLLAVYLYVGRNKEAYAVMRAMGVPGRIAGGTLVLPLAMLSAAAMPVGGAVGLLYTSKTAVNTIATMTNSAADVYVPDTALPVEVIIMCLLFELVFTLSITMFFLRKMKKTSPLELLQGDTLRAGADTKAEPDKVGYVSMYTGPNLMKLSMTGKTELSFHKKYNAIRHVTAYVLRHMRRAGWKSAVSLALTAVLVSGVGMLSLSRVAYQDAFYEVDVNASALEFVSSNVIELSKSDLVKDFYGYNSFSIRTNGQRLNSRMVSTNDLDRYLTDSHISYSAAYADGYDISDLNNETKPVCIIGESLADTLGLGPGDEIALIAETRYAALAEMFDEADIFEDEEEFKAFTENKAVKYKVIGTITSSDITINNGIFTRINDYLEDIYGQPFPFGYCECKLADNEKLEEFNSLMMNLKNTKAKYSKRASFYIDSEALEDITRVRSLLEELFPIAVAAVLLIGLTGHGLIILQSAKEAAFLRILGVTKKRARCMLALEQILLCTIGIVLVAGGLALYDPETFVRSAQTLVACYVLYFMGCLCGASAAAVQVTRHRILELLQVKE